MKRNLVVGGVVVALLATVLIVKLRGGEHAKPAGTANGSAAARPVTFDRDVDPRKLARASISGSVTDAATKAPIANARVCGDPSATALSEQDVREPSCAVTDARGAYTLKDVLPASYELAASAKSYRPAMYTRPGERTTKLIVAPGEATTNIDIALRPGGVELTGTVSDLTGGPIAGAFVRAHDRYIGYAAPVTTDAEGHFTIWTTPGPVHAFASAEGYTGTGDDARAPGTIELWLTPESSLAGVVIDAKTNQPVPDVPVRANLEGGGWGETDATSDVTDAQGAFRISRLPPGRYTFSTRSAHGIGDSDGSTLVGLGQHVEGVVVRMHAAVRVSGKLIKADGSPCTDGWVSMRDRVNDDHSASGSAESDGTVDIDPLLPGTYKVEARCRGARKRDDYPDIVVADKDITGQVWPVDAGSSVRGRVTTASGDPVAGARIQARSVAVGARDAPRYGDDDTAPDGSFVMGWMYPGTYTVDVNTDLGNPPTEGWTVEVPPDAVVEKNFVLEDGGALAGTVVDTSDKPVAGANIDASPTTNGRKRKETKTAADGSFKLERLLPIEHFLSISGRWGSLRRADGSFDTVKIEAGKTTNVRVVVETQNGVIRGTVLDMKGVPSPDAFINIARESDKSSSDTAIAFTRYGRPIITGTDGTFTISGLGPGKYAVRAYTRGGGEAIAEHVPVGGNAKLQLRATGSLSGTVTGGGAVIESLRITLQSTTGFRRDESYLRSSGTFTLDNLPAGTFELSAITPTAYKRMTVTVAEGEARTGVTIALDPFVTLTGRIVDATTKQPVPRLDMFIQLRLGSSGYSIRGTANNRNVTDDTGRFLIESVPLGTVELHGFAKSGEQSEYHVNLTREITGTGTVDLGDILVTKRK